MVQLQYHSLSTTIYSNICLHDFIKTYTGMLHIATFFQCWFAFFEDNILEKFILQIASNCNIFQNFPRTFSSEPLVTSAYTTVMLIFIII